MTDNESSLVDEDGDFPDWIEIYNPDQVSVDLSGWHLTDDEDDLSKWKFPRVLIPPGGFVVVFASGKDKRIATSNLHTNFQLSSDGEYLGLVEPDGLSVVSEIAPEYPSQQAGVSYGTGTWGLPTEAVLVEADSSLNYLIPRDDALGASWQQPRSGFDDSSWESALQPVGFESSGGQLEPLIVTNIASAMKGINAGGYFRFPFQFDARERRIVAVRMKIFIDDGYVAYLNGTKVAGLNERTPLLYNSTASGSRADNVVISSPIEVDLSSNAGLIRGGENVLAIHAATTSANSSDFLLGVELVADVQDTGGGLQYGFFDAPTPGAPNRAITSLGKVADTKFNNDRGFYSAPIDVEITTATDGAVIRYTTDGSEPSAGSGIIYNGPIAIDSTTTLRAAAFKQGYFPTDVDTHTYLFLDDIIRQSSSAPPGWPSGSVNGQVYRYGMNQSVVNNSNSSVGGVQRTKDALMSLPTISLVTDQSNLTSSSTGIYSNPGSDGINWERESSLEFIHPPGWEDPDGNKDGFQSPCGLRIRGGFSRRTQNPKHSFRLFFRGVYGNGRLNYKLFGDEGTDVFDKFDLRGPQNYSWAMGGTSQNSFIRDTWSRDLQGEMGHPYKRGRWVHVYLNGIYWGMYQIDERAEANYGETYFGGDEDDYDVVKSFGGVTDGNRSSYQRLWQKWQGGFTSNADFFAIQGKNPEGIPDPALERLVDIENLIDYMIITYYTGDRDGPGSRYTQPRPNNYFGVYNRENPDGYKFFEHDSEHSLGTGENNMVSPFTRSSSLTDFNPHTLHERLASSNAEYRLLFSDRVAGYCYNGGLLTDAAGIARVDRRAAQIDTAIIAHSARWGSTSRTRQAWLGAVQGVRNFITGRVPVVIGQLRSVGWYPDIDPPRFSQHGGYVSSTQQLFINGGPGIIYYTVDGTDPRELGGAVSQSARVFEGNTSTDILLSAGSSWKYLDDGSDQGRAWRDKGFDDSDWSRGAAELGYGDGDEATELDFGDDSDNKHATTYFRSAFNVSNAAEITGLNMRLLYDDGVAIYLNGKEFYRSANMSADMDFDAYTVGGVDTPSEDFQRFDGLPSQLLEDGLNTVAVEIKQGDGGSSDISFDLELTGVKSAVANPLLLSSPGNSVLSSRVRDGNEWSAITRASFLVDAEPANESNLAISEIHYRPSLPSESELAQGFNERSDFEFIELRNTGNRHVNLAGVEFTSGIGFEFSDEDETLIIAPGANVLLVNNVEAFTARYGDGLPVAGEFSGNLDNDGEELLVSGGDGTTLINFTYNDAAPWPESADGDGFSLVAVFPDDPDQPENWRSSADLNGNPGGEDSFSYAFWSEQNGLTSTSGDDPDGDGLNNLMEYAFGGDPLGSSAEIIPFGKLMPAEGGGIEAGFLTLDLRRRLGADDARLIVESSGELKAWSNEISVPELLRVINNGDGTETLTYRLGQSVTEQRRVFLRVRAVLGQ
ncbi:MAG: lamin tail domain-containing protein [Verrucomicrobiales bacterium]|nr:lamin tail domain-containing protein [Verrucomicrobiales bacterium]